MTSSLAFPDPAPHTRPHFTRIERVLDYIHAHLDQPLSLEQLAEQSCWSRWQLQRVFLHETGQTVAHYVRELKLSLAAEALLSSRQRVLDLALNHGFGSEVSFSRAFKQHFGCSPLAYRKRGLRLGLRTPLVRVPMPLASPPRLVQVRVESRPGFTLHGVRGEIRGLFAKAPDFQQTVPAIWGAWREAGGRLSFSELLGVVDVSGGGAAALLGRGGGRGGERARPRAGAPQGTGTGVRRAGPPGPHQPVGAEPQLVHPALAALFQLSRAGWLRAGALCPGL